MLKRLLVLCSKILIALLRLVGKNGSALPGLIIERLYPEFLSESLKSQEHKVILVTGTNGKTTTTKMLVAALRGSGASVVTNATGSNMTRGLISAVVEDMSYLGTLKPTDWFVFEMDEAYAPIFTQTISPKLVLALNILRDQLDRYGELDKTAKLIGDAASKSEVLVYNGLDPLLASVANECHTKSVALRSFGVSKALFKKIANEQTLHGSSIIPKQTEYDACLMSVRQAADNQQVSISSGGQEYQVKIPMAGFHNALNTVAIVTTLREILGDSAIQAVDAIATMSIPFGRGEKLYIGDKSITVALVKNPSGFTTNLETFVKKADPDVILFVVNDKIADGRDVSWLWDVNFRGEIDNESKVYTSGIRAYDMALRLKHDGIGCKTVVSVKKAIQMIIESKYQNIIIIPTYTALFEVRDALSDYGEVPRIW